MLHILRKDCRVCKQPSYAFPMNRKSSRILTTALAPSLDNAIHSRAELMRSKKFMITSCPDAFQAERESATRGAGLNRAS